jgi:hypothetical protein
VEGDYDDDQVDDAVEAWDAELMREILSEIDGEDELTCEDIDLGCSSIKKVSRTIITT